jgi:hypothetical protein
LLKQRTFEPAKEQVPQDFKRMRTGLKDISDATIDVGNYSKINPNFGNKNFILNALYKKDLKTLREISNFYYRTSGIYYRLCRYLAFLYRYDWYIDTYIIDVAKEKEKEGKVLSDFSKVLNYFDNSDVKHICNDIALDVIRDGVYYGILIDRGDRFSI